MDTFFYKDIVSYPFDFSDEEIVDNYMSMLKGFSTNLKAEIFSRYLSMNGFAVITGTIMFMNYHESMIKTAARTVILSTLACNFYVVKPSNIKDYIIQSGFFNCFVSFMADKLSVCDRYILSSNLYKLESSLSEIQEDLYYINDIFQLQIIEFNEILTNLLLKNLIYPVAIGSLGIVHHNSFHVSIPLAAMFLYNTLKIVKYPDLINSLVVGLLVKSISSELLELIQDTPSPNLDPKEDYLYYLNLMLDYLEGFGDLEDLKSNPVPEAVFSFLTSKDNNLVGVILILVHSVITSVSVKNSILLAAGLIPYERIKMKKLLNYILEEHTKINYNEKTIEIILNLLNYDQPLRIFHFKLACKIIISLAYRSDTTQCLNSLHQTMLNKLLKIRIDALAGFLTDSSDYDVFFEEFEKEWKTLDDNSKVQCPLHLLLPYVDDIADLPLEQRDPLDEVEALKCEIKRFFLVWSVKLALNKDETIFPLDVYPLYYMSNNFSWEKGKKYQIDLKNTLKCIVKYKRLEENSYFIYDPDFFLLGQAERDDDYIEITFMENLLNIEAIDDRSDPRRLVVVVVKDQDQNLEIMFPDPQKCLSTLKDINNSKLGCRERYIMLISKLFSQLSSCD